MSCVLPLGRRTPRIREPAQPCCRKRDRQAVQRRLVRRLQQLGLKVTLEPITPGA
jgi:hypothetical protein